jgi:DNA invertase Pin-like site-specific DNA recombinase
VGQREELLRGIEFVREGDVLIVTKLDRLARSVRHLCELVRTLEQKKVGLRIIDMGLDTATPTGRLMINLLGSIAQFEREVMLERQRVGIAKAKSEGRYKGRKPVARQKAPEIQHLRQAGLSPSTIARQLGISRASVYRNS